ncbi:hypothetical protein FJ250_08550 [bacterium]|nr:hypothetical protein [bacterium]
MIMRAMRTRSSHLLLAAVLALAATARPARSQTVDLQPLLLQREVTAIVEVGGRVFAGLDGGGLATAPVGDLGAVEVWTASADLSGNNITDLAWSGAHLWIATDGGGLTRVTDPGGAPTFRQYASNLGGRDLTAVAGAMVGGSERVYYAMEGAGIGQIIDGLSGNLYTAEQDGLIANDVNALQIWQGQLFIGTPVGVSRFAANVFTNQNAGLGSLVVNDFAIESGGSLLAATNGGVYRWNDAASTWQIVRSLGVWVTRVSCRQNEIWALGLDSSGNGVLEAATGGVWRTVALTNPKCRSVHAGADVWIGGRSQQVSGSRVLEQAYLGRREAGDQFTFLDFRASLARSVEGVTFTPGGDIWIGDWRGAYVSRLRNGAWTYLWESAHVAPDSNGIFTAGGNVLCMAAGPDGTVWANQFTQGILRIDGATGKVNHLTSTSSGLSGHFVVNLVTHPDGPLIAMHDVSDAQKVDVLIDPDGWRNPANWITLPLTGGLGTGPSVWDALVERRDVIWFAVENVGLVRWDVNGDLAGPGDPLTWADQSDDRWDAPIAGLAGTAPNLGRAVGLALGRDGTLWAGGNGVVQFTYDEAARRARLLTAVGEKFTASSVGLVNGNVADLAVDANGDVWVATRTGLNRIRGSGGDVSVAVWIDLQNYYGSTTYQALYSANTIAPLPGLSYRKIVADGAGRRLLLTSDQGTVLLTVGAGGGGDAQDALTLAFCYPNPWVGNPLAGAGLRLGGLPAGVTADEPATVEIYDLQGELVYRDPQVTADTAFWNGTSRMGGAIQSGYYLLRLSWRGFETTMTLAVVR